MGRIAGTLCLAALLGACADLPLEDVPADAPPVPDFVEKVRNGTLTQERPEVGSLSFGCTGTLVAPDLVVTASHCVGYGSALQRGNYGTFTIEAADGTKHRFGVQRYRGFSRQLGSADVALLQLADRVDAAIARPRPVARTTPANGTDLSVWGYGCTERGRSTDWRKRRADFTEGEATNHLCPGDSGGPVFDESNGAVLRINSGYYQDRFGTDIFGHLPTVYDQVRAQMEEWSAGGIPEIGADPEDPGSGPEDVEPEPEQPDEPQSDRCGVGQWRLFPQWVCTPDGRYKYQCVQGGAPTWVECAAGCRASRAGEDALCGEDAVPQYREGCGVWEPYTDWTCARDGRTLVRCAEDQVQAYRCRSGCSWVAGPDRCRF
ncbi:MAG: trypsin-like serine protease [Myxococcales bacterium]|nr:trypsin-like serine protease [Myxococcales bacterium]